MKTVEVKLYQYLELSDKAKEKARLWFLEGNDFQFEWDCIKEDAKNAGIKLNSWEYRRSCEGEFINSALFCAESIIKEHGEICETYKTAKDFIAKINGIPEDEEDARNEVENDFLNSILEDYRIMADKQYEYCESEEYIAEMMECNKYDFLEDGTRF